MIDVLFVVPKFSYKSLDEASSRSPNLGIAMLAAVLEKEGYRVKIIDAFVLGLSKKEIAQHIRKEKPRILAVTSVTANSLQALEILKVTKIIDSSITTVYGGPHVTIMPDKALEASEVDYVVVGEGEETIVELADYILHGKGEKSGIKGIGYRDKEGNARINEARGFIKDLDKLPMPAYHLLPMDAYRAYGWLDEGRKFCTMITSRGCPFKCTYCTSSNIFGYRWRHMSADRVFEEMKLLYDKYGINHFYFQDDEFTVDHQRVIDICNKILESRMDIIWECLTRVSHVDDELLKKMAETGCKSILYGIECGYQEGIDKINKKITLKQAMDAVKFSKKHGISPKVTFMMGFPWESKKEIKKTISFAKKLNADLTFFNILNPYPGTPLYEEIKRDNLFVRDYSWDRYSPHGEMPVIRTKYLTEKELAYWNGRAYLSLYLSPRYFIRKLKLITNFQEFKRAVKSASGLFLTSFRRIIAKK